MLTTAKVAQIRNKTEAKPSKLTGKMFQQTQVSQMTVTRALLICWNRCHSTVQNCQTIEMFGRRLNFNSKSHSIDNMYTHLWQHVNIFDSYVGN